MKNVQKNVESGTRLTNTNTRKNIQGKQYSTYGYYASNQPHIFFYSINNYSEITVTKQTEMSKILSTTKNIHSTSTTNLQGQVNRRKHSTGPVAVCRGNLAHEHHECLHLAKCLPGLPATISQEIKININSSLKTFN